MCYNTLKRVNDRVKADPESLAKIHKFMDEEKIAYAGDVKVRHLLELLRDDVKFEAMAKKVRRPLTDLRVASYYGCLLVRPKGVGLDDMENPTVLDDLARALGAQPVDFPYKTECCGAYQTVDKPEAVADRTFSILEFGRPAGRGGRFGQLPAVRLQPGPPAGGHGPEVLRV